MKRIVLGSWFLVLGAIGIISCGGTTASQGTSGVTGAGGSATGTRGGVSGDLLGSGSGTAAIYIKSNAVASPSTSVRKSEKTVSYGGGTVTTFEVEILNLLLHHEDGTDVSLDVNDTIDLADPDYDAYINFLTSQTVSTGNYTGVGVALGEVTFVASGISPDPTESVEAYANQTIEVDTAFSIREDGELAIPLVLDVESILADGFGMTMDTPFAIRVSILPLLDVGSIWTTGDMIGLADGFGFLYAIDDIFMNDPIGTYSEVTSTAGTYLFTGGTYIGIQGTYVITPGGAFAGDADGFFSLNGDYDGGFWVEENGGYGTFALDDGWTANGTGTFTGANMSIEGTLLLNSGATGGSWESTSTDTSGTFSLE